MKKITLVDGNSLMFRAYYATAYTGNLMQNKKGLYTNALFGFINMMQKVYERSEYLFVAFDKGKQTFRHLQYSEYKGGRKVLPDEFRQQIPYIKKYLDILNIKHDETYDFEADDLIASMAHYAANNGYEVEVISGDKDLLQLVDENIIVFLTKSGVKELDEYNALNFKEKMNILPTQVIDYKGLVGDSSDNLPGIKGVGAKTATTLLDKYGSLEGIYEHIDELKGKIKILFEENKEQAFRCKYLATLRKDADIIYSIDELKVSECLSDELVEFYKEMEFETFIKRVNQKKIKVDAPQSNSRYQVILDNSKVELSGEGTIMCEVFLQNYYTDQILGVAVMTDAGKYFFKNEGLKNDSLKEYLLSDNKKNTFDYKKLLVVLKRLGLGIKNVQFDLLLASYIINPSYAFDDMRKVIDKYCENSLQYVDDVYGSNSKIRIPAEDIYISYSFNKCEYINICKEEVMNRLNDVNGVELLNLELNLSDVLGEMEFNGLKISIDRLTEIGIDLSMKAEEIEDKIYMISQGEFNINSPKQLGEVLFEKLHLPHGKKTKTGSYSTSVDVLEKLSEDFEIARLVLEYRAYTKIISTYVNGLKEFALDNEIIHPLYKQALTQTGRLSSVEPNIQNIPVRSEVGQTIREAFISRFDDGKIVTCDYSQIELRVLAHMSGDAAMITAFNSGVDFHKKTASEMYEVRLEDVTKDMRRTAKAINFGIIYGMSAWGLSESLKISPKQANNYITKYFETYAQAKQFLDNLIVDARNKGYTETILGRRRYIEEINSTNQTMRSFGERTAMNSPIQGSAADIIKLAMIKVNKKLKDMDVKSIMIAQVHDELVFDCPRDEVELIKETVKETMEGVLELQVPLISEANYGKNWFEAK